MEEEAVESDDSGFLNYGEFARIFVDKYEESPYFAGDYAECTLCEEDYEEAMKAIADEFRARGYDFYREGGGI